MNANYYGHYFARIIGYLHELGSGSPVDVAMDLHNNEVGFRIGSKCRFAGDRPLVSRAMRALNMSLLITAPDPMLVTEHHRRIADPFSFRRNDVPIRPSSLMRNME